MAFQQPTLYAKVSGYLKSIAVDKGDKVAAGAILARIEIPETHRRPGEAGGRVPGCRIGLSPPG